MSSQAKIENMKASEQELKLRPIIAYSFGDIANNFAFAMGALFLLNYYTDVAGITAAAAGTMLMLVRIFDAFADIGAGRLIDVVNTRWGKFRPFLLFGSVPLMCFSVLVFCVPADWSHSQKVFYAYLTYMGLGVCYSLVNIPYGSLATAMTQLPRSRARLAASRSIGASLTFVGLALLLGPKIKSFDKESMQSVYLNVTVALAFIGVALYYLCFYFTRENVKRTISSPSLRISLDTLMRNTPLMILCLGAFFTLAGTFSVTSTAVFYCRYVLKDTGLFVVIVVIQMLIGMVLTAPLVPLFVSKLGKKWTFLIGLLIAFVGYLLFYTFSQSAVFLAFGSLAISAVGMGLAMTVIWALEADTVEYGEYVNGVRIEGLTYSFFSFTRKCGQAVGGSVPAFIFGITGYVANQEEQTPEALSGICMSISLIPAIFVAIAFLIMLFYPLSDKKFLSMLKEIQSRKSTGKAT